MHTQSIVCAKVDRYSVFRVLGKYNFAKNIKISKFNRDDHIFDKIAYTLLGTGLWNTDRGFHCYLCLVEIFMSHIMHYFRIPESGSL